MTNARVLAVAGALTSLSMMIVMGGCNATPAGAPPKANAVELPFGATPSEALKPLAFMQGRWVRSNPNFTTNEETWSPAYGNAILGVFRQVRRDGKPALFEVSLITVEETGIELRLRHLHAGLVVPEERKELDLFKLLEADGTFATFAGTGKAEGMRMTYRRTGPVSLRQEIDFPEGSREKDYSMDYVLGGEETFSTTPPPPPKPRPAPAATPTEPSAGVTPTAPASPK
jgi:hypothetical protein